MTEPIPPQKPPNRWARGYTPLPPALVWRLAMARGVLIWERLWPALWPPIGLIGLFLVLSFLDVWRVVPNGLLALIIFGLVFGAGYLTWRNLGRVRLPDRRDGLRRLEDDSGLEHRPLSSFDDKPAAGADDPGGQALWRAHKVRLASKLKMVSLPRLRGQGDKHDPYALRVLLILALVVSLIIAGAEWGDRLRSAIAPFLGPPLSDDAEIDAWIEPPGYTGLPVITLASRVRAGNLPEALPEAVSVPQGSVLKLRVTGFDALPTLTLDPDKSRRDLKTAVKHTDSGIEGTGTITENLTARLSYRGRKLLAWPIAVEADGAPKIALLKTPETTIAASLAINYSIEDDYGVEKVSAIITAVPRSEADIVDLEKLQGRPGDGTGEEPLWPRAGEPFSKQLAAPKGGPGPYEESALENFADHPWAGREVLFQLEAVDGAGNKAYTEEKRFLLPERIFLDPLARAVIEQRRVLADNPRNTRPVALALDALTVAPELFIKDTVTYLALRSAHYRLVKSTDPKHVREVYDMLWSTALHIEDGNLSQARDRLRQIQKRLSEALARNAPASEIRQLMAQLREAIGQYIAELMREADEGGEIADADMRTLQSDDLGALMNSIEQMAAMGAHEQARQLLSQLGQILDSLRPTQQAGGSGGGRDGQSSPQQRALGEGLDKLGDIIGGQRGLMDETNRTIRPASPGRMEMGHELSNLEDLIRRSFGDRAPQNPLKRPPPDAENTPPGGQGETGLPPPMPGWPQPLFEGLTNPQRREAVAPVDPAKARELARKQQELREALNEAVRDLASAGIQLPDSMGAASDAMGDSRSDLEQGELPSSIQDQQAALDALRQGAEDLASDLLARSGKQQRGRARAERDPLGRPSGGDNGRDFLDTGQVKLPDKADFLKAREILEELRRRAGERNRPKIELDYYDRLLRQF